jgi:hypothetical protein
MKRMLVCAIAAVAAFAVPRPVWACPVCFGQSDAPMAIATNNGVLMLLVVIVCVLAAFASFFVYLARRAALADRRMTGDASARFDTQEGTAQC